MRRAQGDAAAYRNREIVSVFTPRQNGKACRIPTKSSPFFRCSHHRKILCYVRMETVRIPMRAVFRFQVIKTFIIKREASSPFSRNNSKRSPLYSLCRSGHDRLYSKRVTMNTNTAAAAKPCVPSTQGKTVSDSWSSSARKREQNSKLTEKNSQRKRNPFMTRRRHTATENGSCLNRGIRHCSGIF